MMNGKPVLNILEVGSGTGYVTYLLRKAFPNAQIMAVDIAEGMIKVARERIHDDSVTFICGDIESINLDGKFDLIISNATFQWFNEPRKTLEKLKNYLTSKGSLYFSTFGENTFSELHSCYEKTQIGNDANVKPGQAFLSKAELESMLSHLFNHNQLEVSETNYIEAFDSCLSFFESIKKIGANNAQDASSVKDPKFIYKVIDRYEKDFKLDGRVQATYHALFVKASI